jgi:hypothetical protein
MEWCRGRQLPRARAGRIVFVVVFVVVVVERRIVPERFPIENTLDQTVHDAGRHGLLLLLLLFGVVVVVVVEGAPILGRRGGGSTPFPGRVTAAPLLDGPRRGRSTIHLVVMVMVVVAATATAADAVIIVAHGAGCTIVKEFTT